MDKRVLPNDILLGEVSALLREGRADLIGFGDKFLIPPREPRAQATPRKQGSQAQASPQKPGPQAAPRKPHRRGR